MNVLADRPPALWPAQASQAIEWRIPDTISLERAHTLNGYGYVFYIPSPLLMEFLENEANPGKRIIEVGAGFGNAPIEALKKGVLEYTANDLCDEHLKILMTRLHTEIPKAPSIQSANLKLLPGKAPEVLPKVKNYYDAILIDKVMHFFSPDEVQAFLEWSYDALTKNGRLYILTISPYISSFREKVLPLYEKNKSQNNKLPGYMPDVNELMQQERKDADPKYRVPRQMIFFKIEDLAELFEKNGFDICTRFSLQLPTEANPKWQDVQPCESSLVGLIVQKR